MGRKWNKKGKTNSKPETEEGKLSKVDKPKRERTADGGYIVAKKENKDFETFYKKQELVSDEEWPAFMSSLVSSLPAAFRITGNSTQAEALREILINDYFKPLENLSPEELISTSKNSKSNSENINTSNGNKESETLSDSKNVTANSTLEMTDSEAGMEEPVKPLQPVCLSWYPRGLAYQLNLSRRDIRRSEAYWRLHQCLISETDTGNISRQEAVSMIPPLLLDVQPHHKVLDMCAAPGSKTAQIIEQLHSSPDALRGAIPTGVVVANDSDNKRCYLLTHQAKRLQSPCIIITNHDAAFMPNMFYTKNDGSTGKLKYDRILCDVPCSGDGTLRKNCDVWGKWNPVNGANLHGLQLRIARRGLELLAVGGRMVYSTCSMSPMEDEAVMQRLLLETEGAVSLVDCTGALPGLKYRKGLTKWCVMSKDMEVIPSAADIPLKWTNVYHKHLFPVDQDLGLDRCLRLLPHQQDTGGFFVAVLQKNAPLPGERQDSAEALAPQQLSQRVKPQSRKRRRDGYREEPYFYMSDSIAQWEAARGTTPSIISSEPRAATASVEPQAQEQTNSVDGKLKPTTQETQLSESEKNHCKIDKVSVPDGKPVVSAGGTDGELITAGGTDSEPTTAGGTDSEPVTAGETDGKPVTAGGTDGKLVTANHEPTEDNKISSVEPESTSRDQDRKDSSSSAKTAAPTKLAPEVDDLRIWSTISPFFGLRTDIPEASYRNFMTRSREGKRRNLYFTNALVRDLITRNQDRMKIINTGVKVLVRVDNKGTSCDFRLAQEGVQSLVPLLTKRRVVVTKEDLLTLLNDDDNDTPPDLATMSAGCQRSVSDMETGSVLLEYAGDPSAQGDSPADPLPRRTLKMELVGWKGKSSIRCYVARNDRVHYLRLLGADTSRFLKNKFLDTHVGGVRQGDQTGDEDAMGSGDVMSKTDGDEDVVGSGDVIPKTDEDLGDHKNGGALESPKSNVSKKPKLDEVDQMETT
ncbi:RNA cytosine-C(5)-methyltransferase NSUN2 [Hyalella azteca]|uniref:tRNA (cytosine(34)-C(5))-methyltransferase n=1 Tax=Hyalella azteca TaxID=294128 RepID=A0A8B7NQC6_HYAAZ|nr:RNA cytosine-C(5)-methyltransferase NSUN2 [Hyalella azteca]